MAIDRTSYLVQIYLAPRFPKMPYFVLCITITSKYWREISVKRKFSRCYSKSSGWCIASRHYCVVTVVLLKPWNKRLSEVHGWFIKNARSIHNLLFKLKHLVLIRTQPYSWKSITVLSLLAQLQNYTSALHNLNGKFENIKYFFRSAMLILSWKKRFLEVTLNEISHR